jgi:molybdopterin/thiamine biosynthesis adenylyltransferase
LASALPKCVNPWVSTATRSSVENSCRSVSNIQRQVGADIDHLGRNKAEVVGEMAVNLTRNVNIDVFPEG